VALCPEGWQGGAALALPPAGSPGEPFLRISVPPSEAESMKTGRGSRVLGQGTETHTSLRAGRCLWVFLGKQAVSLAPRPHRPSRAQGAGSGSSPAAAWRRERVSYPAAEKGLAKELSEGWAACVCLCCSNCEVLTTLTPDTGRILSKLHTVQPKGKITFCTGIRVAHVSGLAGSSRASLRLSL